MSKYSFCSDDRIKDMIRDKVFGCIDHILTDHETGAEQKIAQLDGVMALMISVIGEMEAEDDAGGS